MSTDLKEIATTALRLADAASATPWRRGEAHAHDRHLSADEYGIAWVGTACDRLDAPGYNFEVRQRNGQRDGDFIAFSREALPALARGYLALLAVAGAAEKYLKARTRDASMHKQIKLEQALAAARDTGALASGAPAPAPLRPLPIEADLLAQLPPDDDEPAPEGGEP